MDFSIYDMGTICVQNHPDAMIWHHKLYFFPGERAPVSSESPLLAALKIMLV